MLEISVRALKNTVHALICVQHTGIPREWIFNRFTKPTYYPTNIQNTTIDISDFNEIQ